VIDGELAAADAAPLPFIDGLRQRIAARRADGGKLAVLLVDLGVVARIDGVWGYHAGDAARARLAAGLRSEVLREDDLVGDMARDDLACVLSAVSSSDLCLLAAEKLLRGLTTPLWFGDDEIYARPAIGIALFPEHGNDADTLLQQAKAACIAARGLPERIALCAEGLANPDGERMLYENRLRAAVADDALEMVFQPQYDLSLGQIMGIETQLRWPAGTKDIVLAIDAFAAAEAAGVVAELVSSMLNRALRNRSDFRYSAGIDVRIAINLPARALLETALPEIIERALRTWNVGPARLMIELVETASLETEPVARETFAQLVKLGIKFCVDDPTASVASLFWLAAMPFTEFKIDLSGLGIAGEDEASALAHSRVAQSLVALAHLQNMTVIAFGVSDDAVASMLKQAGCDGMQGDYKGPPLPPAEFVVRYGDA
jgi:diguanylate cyclase (GGDEF)-like protein